jgi:hypothetical protein
MVLGAIQRTQKSPRSLSRAWSAEKGGSRLERDHILRSRGANAFQCSGEMPCTQCTLKDHVCVINPRTDCRRRSHLLELSQLHRALESTVGALESTVAQLRHENLDEVRSLILAIRRFKMDREAMAHLTGKNI